MGWIVSSGSLARVLGAIVMTQIYVKAGPLATFGSLGVLNLLGLIVAIALFRKLSPPIAKQEEGEEEEESEKV